MLTLLHVIGSKTLGGAESFYVRLLQALHERGERVIALVRKDGPVGPIVPSPIELQQVPMRTVWDPLSRWQVSRTVRALKPDIVQTYMGRATRLTHVHGSGIIHIARLGGFYKLDGYRHADAWIGNTAAICDYLRTNGFPPDRVFHIPNFINPVSTVSTERLVELRAELNLPTDAYVLVGVGRLIAKKGFADLIAAFAKLPRTIQERPVHLVVVGAGKLLSDLQAHADRLGVGDRTHWPGWQNDLSAYYALADIFVCPSLHEPLGNVIIEAWGQGVPVVSTETHGARELITDGINGLLVPCADPGRLAQRVEQLLRDDTARRQLGENGRQKLNTEYNREKVVADYLELYHRLLRR